MSVPGSRCGDCGEMFLPPREGCSHCGGGTVEHEVAGRGVLRSWTVVRSAPEGFEPPYVVGVVELEEGVLAVARGPGEDDVPALDTGVVVEPDGEDGLRFRASAT